MMGDGGDGVQLIGQSIEFPLQIRLFGGDGKSEGQVQLLTSILAMSSDEHSFWAWAGRKSSERMNG